jgi:hypothetical protein
MRVSREIPTLLAAIAVTSLLTGTALAEKQLLIAIQAPDQQSSFTLDFGIYGSSEAIITNTTYLLELDPVNNSAAFLDYYQEIDPLTLPGGVSTGDITVTIVPGSSSGTYDAATGQFETEEFYSIAFTGDLSMYGLESPVHLPSSSVGQINYNGPDTGQITLHWSGQGQLDNPSDPDNPIIFEYECATETNFSPPQIGDMNCDGAINTLDIDPFIAALQGPDAYDNLEPNCDRNLADVNGDGAVDTLDIDAFVGVLLNG